RLVGAFDRLDAHTTGALMLGSTLLAVGALLASPRLGARGLPWAAGAAAGVSLGTTVAIHVIARLPVGAQGITPVRDPYALTEPAALLGLLTLTVWRGAPLWAALSAPACFAAVILRPLAVGVGETTLVVAFFFTLAATAALGIGLTVRLVIADRRRREASVRMEQRTEFARDLHDFVAHHVTGIVIQAQGARSVAARRPELVPPALERIEHAGAEALKSMRSMVGMLRDVDESRTDVPLAPLAGMAEVRALVEEFATVGGSRARLRADGDFADLPVEVATTVHRVVMEALTNVRKHSRDYTEVEVHLTRSAGGITVRISDDGRPRQAVGQPLGGGFGLKGLAERVAVIGGRVRTGPAPAGGWRVEATLPVDHRVRSAA
ncbi:histidine kinase, partial [Streptomyces sp. OF3]